MLKLHNPTTPTRRHRVSQTTRDLSNNELPARLTKNVKYHAGRSHGKVSIRHRGGRVKRQYLVVDFKRDNFNIEGRVDSIHYDANRSANVAMVTYKNGDKRLILATKNMFVKQTVISGDEAEIREGNAMPLKRIPSGSFVHNVEIKKGSGGVLGRSAGVSIQKQGETGEYAQLKMPSGEIRLVKLENYATLGEVGNEFHSNTKIGKAGRKRKMGIKPTVRGVAMSWKHPHGSGQGKKGRKGTGGPPSSPWGKRQGTKTRANKSTNKYIIRRKTSKTRPNVGKYKTIV